MLLSEGHQAANKRYAGTERYKHVFAVKSAVNLNLPDGITYWASGDLKKGL